MLHPYHQQQQYNSHIMYEYRFSENRIERWPLAGSSNASYPYPNSAESNSPPAWESAGSSPEFLNLATCSRPRPSHRPQRTTSPVNSSVISPTRVTTMRRSALRQHGHSSRRGPAKSVQWVSDIKKKPQEISSDRKIVKVQVKQEKLTSAQSCKQKMFHFWREYSNILDRNVLKGDIFPWVFNIVITHT